MKKTLSSLTVAAVALFAGQAALAQSAPSRAEVKKETTDANKAGQIPGTGTGPAQAQMGETSPKQKAATSTTSREERKKETAAANKAGTIPQTEAQMQNPKK